MTTRFLIPILCAGSLAIWANNNAAVLGPVTGFVFDAHGLQLRLPVHRLL